jgi:hypothetical protein
MTLSATCQTSCQTPSFRPVDLSDMGSKHEPLIHQMGKSNGFALYSEGDTQVHTLLSLIIVACLENWRSLCSPALFI